MKVLIAEDDPISRRLLQGHLEKWGHEVTAAADGGEAWRLFQRGGYPLVISDWLMPGIDGPELVRRIRGAERPGYIYVILLTAKAQKADVVQGMEAGADDFVAKPFDHGELRVRVRQGERIVRLEQTLEERNLLLREAQAAVVQHEKMASLGRLAAGMAHEINNPIVYVGNNLAVLRRDMFAALAVLDAYRQGLGAEAARLEEAMDFAYFHDNVGRMCDKSLEGLQRVRDIVKNLRDFARLDEADFKEADINAALQSTLEITAHEIKKSGVQLRTAFADPLPPVLCHPGKVNQVFLNVLLNAIQATAAGREIEVRTRRDEATETGVVIDVRDSGCGIKPENLPHIFDPFFTTKPVGQGTGLGLSVSYGIIRDHGGSIEVESEVGRGTLFRIRLPLRPPPRGAGASMKEKP